MARQGNRKIPSALQFTKLRVIPDQMYFDVENVRTADDALLVIKVMVFFELADIEQDARPDARSDGAISSMPSARIRSISWAATISTAFKIKTEALNRLETYPQLTQRADKIGYRINKVVYRGYYASDKLQAMHDGAIECRTKLHLEAETERQAQELADMKLTSRTRTHRQAVSKWRRRKPATRLNSANFSTRQQAPPAAKASQQQALEAKRREEALATCVPRQQQNELNPSITRTRSMRNRRTSSRACASSRWISPATSSPSTKIPDKVIRIDSKDRPHPSWHLHETDRDGLPTLNHFMLKKRKYRDQVARWPRSGQHILAQYDDQGVVVYQAYRPAIGEFAAQHQILRRRVQTLPHELD